MEEARREPARSARMVAAVPQERRAWKRRRRERARREELRERDER